jgi:putative tricarboxylic transport membrane protein
MFDVIVTGLLSVLSWPALGYMLLAIPIGLVFGMIPGLGGPTSLALLIPFTFGMDPVAGFAFLLGMHAVVHTSGSIPAILFDTPGTGPNAATCIDGFPMAQKGEAGRALGAALFSSMVGGVIGAICLGLVIPIVRPLVLSFGPAEFFMLSALGLTFIALMSGDSILKGLMAGGLGLIFSYVVMDPQTGAMRFTYDILYLYEGIHLVVVVVGLFAMATVIEMAVEGGKSIAGDVTVSTTQHPGSGVMMGIKDSIRRWPLLIRCSILGAVIGMCPGLGGDAAAFFTYGHAVQTSKKKELFGTGFVDGVIAPDSAHNAKEGGNLVPTLAFGIPGGAAMAILLGAFLILGVVPGVGMFTKHLSLVYSMIWVLVLANIIAVLICLPFAVKLAKVTFVRTSIIIPFIVVSASMGAFLTTRNLGNLVVVLAMGFLGYAMKVCKFPRAPLLLGIVLGRISERNLMLSLDLYGPTFIFRPIAFILLLIMFATVFYPVISKRFKKGRNQAAAAP